MWLLPAECVYEWIHKTTLLFSSQDYIPIFAEIVSVSIEFYTIKPHSLLLLNKNKYTYKINWFTNKQIEMHLKMHCNINSKCESKKEMGAHIRMW